MGIDGLAGIYYFLVGRIKFTVSDIVLDGARKELIVLRHYTELFS